MTYCIGIKTNHHLVFASDSRTNAGPDNVSIYSKMFCWGVPGQRQFSMVSAGNLATTQAVVERIDRDIKEGAIVNLFNVKYLSEAADYVGRISVEIQNKSVAGGGMRAGFNAESSFIFGGQILNEEAEIYLIYPQGNHIKPPDSAPFLQIGEIKYGKPLLDRVVQADTTEGDAIRAAMVSMDSTMRSNSTVGPPIEIRSYQINTLQPGKYKIFKRSNPYLRELRQSWGKKILEAFANLPKVPDMEDVAPVDSNVTATSQSQSQSQIQNQFQ
jgi:putative proteasome-type protease